MSDGNYGRFDTSYMSFVKVKNLLEQPGRGEVYTTKTY